MSASPPPLRVTVVGAGAGGLMAAEVLAAGGARVTVFDHSPNIARKLLIAGRGGLNITHSEPLDRLLDRYGPARAALEPAIRAFTPDDLRAWCAGLDEETFIGSSGRVFPKSFRATRLAHRHVERLDELDVEIFTNCRWDGWEDPTDPTSPLLFTDSRGGTLRWATDVTVFALGGASWPRTGSDGGWVAAFEEAGIAVTPLRPANCGFTVAWSAPFRERFAHQPLKNVRLTLAGGPTGTPAVAPAVARGEAMPTATGIEGGVIYALSRELRTAIEAHGTVTVHLDLAPDLDHIRLVARLTGRRPKESVSSLLRRAVRLTPQAIGVLRDATGNRLPDDPEALATLIGAAPLVLTGTEGLERAISTAGGVALAEVDADLQLHRRPGTYVIGEMLDWEAPTGGYLLQATYSTAVAAARAALRRAPVGEPAPAGEPAR